MIWKRLLLILFVLLTGACNLSFSRSGTPTPPPAAPTSAPVIIIEPAGQVVTPEVSGNPNPAAGCTPRTNWPTYTVQAGDTLASIADETGSSIPDLYNANCLQDADAIFEGQTLYVPSAISVNGQPPRVSGQPYQLLISPIASYADGGVAVLQSGATVTLQWAQATDETPDHIEFDLSPTGTGVIPTIIGTATAAQGWAMQWVVPGGVSANLSAVATMSDGTLRTTPLYLVYSGT